MTHLKEHLASHSLSQELAWILPVVAVVLVITGGTIVYLYTNEPKTPAELHTNLMLQVENFDRTRQFGAESKLITSYLKTNPPQNFRYQALLTEGNLATETHDNSAAVNYFKQAVTADGGKLTEFTAEEIGQSAAAGNDTATALSYFQQALQIANANPKLYDDIGDLNATIKNLGGSQ